MGYQAEPGNQSTRYQALPGNADPEALPPILREAEPPDMDSQAEPGNQFKPVQCL
jgi:hypothetical protein